MPRAFLLCWLLLVAGGVDAAERKPNIIVIFTDDQGWADVGCQGQRADLKTPHLDRLAREGVRFTNAYVTAPQCCPSRSGLLTGRYQQRYGHDANGLGPLPLEEVTIAERLGEAGYTTAQVGKWHLDPNPSDREWIERQGIEWRPRRKVRIPFAQARPFLPPGQGFADCFCGNTSRYWATYNLQGESLAPGGEWVEEKGYRLDVQTEAALAFLDRSPDGPFFLYLAYYAPHVPLEATAKYLDRFPGAMPERRRHCLAMMAAIDDGVGRILAKLEEKGIDEDTLLFFISDNGAPLKITKEDRPISFRGGAWDGSLNEPWVGEKGMLTEGGIRVPFLVRWKGTIPAGQVREEPVISLDVAATAAKLAEADSAKLDGVDLVPFLTGAGPLPERALFWRFWRQAAVRDGKWKYLWLSPDQSWLFDLSSPEHEKKNLLDQHPEIATRLRSKLAKWAGELKRPGLPSEKPNPGEVKWYEHYLESQP